MVRRVFIVFIISILSTGFLCAQQWIKSDNLREKSLLNEKYDSAVYYAGESIALIRGILGENNSEYAGALSKLAISHFYLGNYSKAKFFILKEVTLRESIKSSDDRAFLAALENASIISRRTGDYEGALELIRKADKKSLKINGSDSPGYAKTLTCYGGVYYDMGIAVNDMIYLKKAVEYFKKAEAIYLSNGASSENALILNKSDEAAYNNDIGNLPVAEKFLQEIATFAGLEFGVNSPRYAITLNNLGVFYYNSGNYRQAEKYFSEAAGIYSAGKEAGKINAGICINNLGSLYHEMGNYKVAAKMIEDSRKIFENESYQNSPAYAVLLNNLASVYISEEFYASPENKNPEHMSKSGKLLLQADSLFKVNCPNVHPDGLAINSNLSLWYVFNGNIRKSVQMYQDQVLETNMSLKVLAMMNKMESSAFIPMTPEQTDSPFIKPILIPIKVKMVEQVALANASINSSAESDGLTNKLIEMILGKATNLKKAVGEYHPSYTEALKALIVSYASIDAVAVEEELTLEYINVINHKTLQDFSYLSESEKELYYKTRLPDLHSFTSYSLTRKKENPSITCYTYNNILLNKGLMLKSSTAMRVAILGSNDPVLLKTYDEWISLQKEISVLYSTPVDLRTKDLAVLENQANELERSLVSRSQDFSDYRKALQITWEDVRKSLKPDEAAIEFTDFRKKERNGGDATIYAALIVRADSKYPEMIKLFNEDQLEELIGTNSENTPANINSLYTKDSRLYNLIWKPIETYLSGIKSVYISPSGLLFRISFPAITNGTNSFLCDTYQMQVEGSTGNLLNKNILHSGETSALIYGGIRYSNDNSGSDVWNYLEGTKHEGDTVKNILSKGKFDISYLTDNNATETYFKKNAGNFNILHLATHGFFFDDPNEIKFEEKKDKIEFGEVTFRGARGGFGVGSFVNNVNPLMRSGLVLAGANDVWQKSDKGEADDGVLTAQEVTQIDMRKNNLVVLSACETGLGDIKGSEGVYGLQRALKMAGVKNIIMSLWEIPDKETVEFMGKFYERFLALKDIRQAFSEAQNDMRSKYDPYYWGAFVLME